MKQDQQKINLDILSGKPDIKGSVQDIYRYDLNGKNTLLCRTSESGSVFDVGIIFSVPKSDVYRTIIRHLIYVALNDPKTWQSIDENDFKECFSDEEICLDLLNNKIFDELRKDGVTTHHIGMVDKQTGFIHTNDIPKAPSNLVIVDEFPIFKPKRFGLWGKFGWDYNNYFKQPKKVIALENVFRLGSPGGSSLIQRYNAILKEGDEKRADLFLKSIGIVEKPTPWKKFANMIYDCATKFEPEDRNLDWQESIHLSGVPAESYEMVIRVLTYCTVFVNKFFKELGFKLWDLKWEVGVDNNKIVVIDTMDPDSIRVTGTIDYDNRKCFIHFNKQAIRDYYRIIHEHWYASINDAKKRSKTDSKGRDFLQIYKEGVKTEQYPEIPQYDNDFGQIQSEKYAIMVDPFIRNLKKEDLNARIQGIMLKEINFYKTKGKVDRFLEINSSEK